MDLTGRIIRIFGPLSETEHEVAAIPPHAHERASFCLVTRGRFRERGTTFERGDVIFRRPNEEHSNVFDSGGARCFNVLVEPALLDRAGGDASLHAAGPILRRLRREMHSQPCDMVVEGLVLQLIGEIFRSDRGSRSVVADAIRIIESRFTSPLTVRAIAGEIGTHPVHLARTFSRERGASIGQTIRAMRIRYAMDLLRDNGRSIAEIAVTCGFADQSHFTKVFAAVTGTTPRRWRVTAVLAPHADPIQPEACDSPSDSSSPHWRSPSRSS